MKLRLFAYGAFIVAGVVALAIGSATPSEAKSKKKAAPPPPPYCVEFYKPVCAIKGGVQKQTYVNRCFATADGAKVISEGPCKAKKAVHKKKPKKSKKQMKKAPGKEPAKKPAAKEPAKKPADKK